MAKKTVKKAKKKVTKKKSSKEEDIEVGTIKIYRTNKMYFKSHIGDCKLDNGLNLAISDIIPDGSLYIGVEGRNDGSIEGYIIRSYDFLQVVGGIVKG